MTNEGNTTASYTVNLLLNNPVPAGFSTQLLIHKTFTTPAADGCELKEQPHTILLANIPNPQFVTDPTNPNLQNPHLQNPSLQNPTLALAPGETATITFRVVDPNIFDGVAYDASAAVTPAAVAQSVNTVDVAAGDTTPSVALPLTITTSEIPPTTPGAPINRTLQTGRRHRHGHVLRRPRLGTLPPGRHAQLDRHAVGHADHAGELRLHGRVRRQRPAGAAGSADADDPGQSGLARRLRRLVERRWTPTGTTRRTGARAAFRRRPRASISPRRPPWFRG